MRFCFSVVWCFGLVWYVILFQCDRKIWTSIVWNLPKCGRKFWSSVVGNLPYCGSKFWSSVFSDFAPVWWKTLLYICLIFALWVDNVKFDFASFYGLPFFWIFLGDQHYFSGLLSMKGIAKHHRACAFFLTKGIRNQLRLFHVLVLVQLWNP